MALWRWHIRLRTSRSYIYEPIPAGMGSAQIAKPIALDRAPWWQVIDREGWDHRVAMQLLERLEHASFGDLPKADENDADYEDWDDVK